MKVYKVHKSKDVENPGIVYLPYSIQDISDRKQSEEYKNFMKEYHENHKYCPKCGEESHSTTLVGYILNMDKKEEYKDLNRCKCVKCGDVHTSHERVKERI